MANVLIAFIINNAGIWATCIHCFSDLIIDGFWSNHRIGRPLQAKWLINNIIGEGLPSFKEIRDLQVEHWGSWQRQVEGTKLDLHRYCQLQRQKTYKTFDLDTECIRNKWQTLFWGRLFVLYNGHPCSPIAIAHCKQLDQTHLSVWFLRSIYLHGALNVNLFLFWQCQ